MTGPLQADSEIEQNSNVSSTITLLDQHGSEVLLGNALTVPLDSSILYIRPLYVTSTTNPMPQLRYVIAVFNQQVGIEPTLNAALSVVLGATVTRHYPAVDDRPEHHDATDELDGRPVPCPSIL